MQNMLATRGEAVEKKTCSVSGSGNVAIYTIEKLLQLGAKVVTASDSGGFVHDPDGFDEEKLEWLKELKEVRRGRIYEYAEAFPRAAYHADKRPWDVPVDLAFPCATQNELDSEAAAQLLGNGLVALAEGANMPSTAEAVHTFREARILFAPGKAANAGGVAVSGLEQSQNALRISWSREEVDRRLQEIMKDIHARCERYGKKDSDYTDYVDGANIAGFVKVADAMLAYGVV
jgi:glutamate dehydrogenase (NADP+)